MKLTWGPGESAYDAAYKVIKEKYPEIEVVSENFVVQLDIDGYDLTTLLIDNRAFSGDSEHYEWETDWWEGEENVYLIGVAPVHDIDLSTYWSVDEKEEEN